MTATLIVLLIITVLALIFLPFSRALMKDREELTSNPLDRKFQILISRINQLLMGGHGEVIKTNDPRQINLFDENHANMIINFYYSTGSLTIILKYKYYQVELKKEMQFDNMRQAETFRQQDVANHFVEEARIAIQKHQNEVSKQRGLKDTAGEYMFSGIPSEPGSDNPVDLIRGMYDELTLGQKLALVNAAKMIVTADGSSVQQFKSHPQLSDLLLNLQVNLGQAENEFNQSGINGVVSQLRLAHDQGVNAILLAMAIMPFACTQSGPEESRIEKFYEIFERAGYPQTEVDAELEKMMLLSQHFGLG